MVGSKIIGKFLGWIGRGPKGRQPGDGIVHKADNPVATWAEKTAVAHALRLLGAPDHMGRADRYTAHVAKFVEDNPEHPLVKNYREKAEGAGTVAHAGPELVDAVKPLVGAVNFLLAAHGLDERFQRPSNVPQVPIPSVSLRSESAPQSETIALEPEKDQPEDRHTAVLRMHKAGADVDAIAQHLMETHGAKDRATALRWRRAALARAILMHEQSKPAKLAKPKPNEALKPKHLEGQAYRDPVTKAPSRVHPQIAGTALAFHLRQIAQAHPELEAAADKALAWQAHSTNRDGDPFAFIGRKLDAVKSRFSSYYDWKNMERDLLHERAVEAFVKQHVQNPEGLDSFRFFDRAYRQFGGGKHRQSEEFWKRFEKAHAGITREQATEAMHRVADKHLDRAYLEAEDDPNEFRTVLGAAPVRKVT